MNKYEVEYVAYSNHEWTSQRDKTIVEANSEEEAKKIVNDWTNYNYEYFAERIRQL